MRISIDSTEPLTDVVRVVEAVYGVTLTVAATNHTATPPPPTTAHDRGRRHAAKATPPRTNRNRQVRPAKQSAPVSTSQLRSWARQNGHIVSDRGPLPVTVVAAYHATNDG